MLKWISRNDGRPIGLWVLCLVLSFPLLVFLSVSPHIVLQIEKTHPAAAYDRGKELLRGGRVKKAIQSFKSGREFCKQIYEESGLRRHRRLMVYGSLCIADAYKIHGSTDELEQALNYYAEVIRLEPDMSQGQPFLNRGDVLQRLDRHEEAIASYTWAVAKGETMISLFARYNRGLSNARLGYANAACDDWYYYLRFYDGAVYDHQWEAFYSLPECSNPRYNFIRGRAALELGKKEEANKCLKSYLDSKPKDRCAKYLYALAAEEKITTDEGEISLSDCYPPGDTIPINLKKIFFNLYSSKDGNYELVAGLSGEATESILPEISVLLNGMNINDLLISSSQPESYKIPVELQSGKNHVRIIAFSEKATGTVPLVYLHSLMLPGEISLKN